MIVQGVDTRRHGQEEDEEEDSMDEHDRVSVAGIGGQTVLPVLSFDGGRTE